MKMNSPHPLETALDQALGLSLETEAVGIVAPLGRDAALLERRLAEHDITARCYEDVEALCAVPATEHGVLLIATEALTPPSDCLSDMLEAQPSWSHLPVVLLGSGGHAAPEVAHLTYLLGEAYNLTVLTRPVQSGLLVSTLQLALSNRHRQRQVGELVDKLKQARASLEERVDQRTAEVRRLAADLTMAEQHERNRLASVLHDDLQQLLYGLQFRLKTLRADVPDAAPRLHAIDELVREAIDLTRTLAVDLSPPTDERDGFASALAVLVRRMRELHGFTIDIEGDCAVDDELLQTLLFQMVRELLFNVVKHGEVDGASVSIQRTDDACVVQVSDTGRGFDLLRHSELSTSEQGFGLRSIRERIRFLGGTFDLQSRPGEGTIVRLTAPLNNGPAGS